MRHFTAADRGLAPVPHIEHFANDHDLVAWLGMLAPDPAKHKIRIDGPMFVRPDGWGHLLNQHYLFDIERHQRRGRAKGARGGSCPFALRPGTATVR